MTPKKHIGKISETNLLLICAFIRELKPDEDLFIEVNKGVIMAVKIKDGERYYPLTDNDFLECMVFRKEHQQPLAKLTFPN